MLNSKDRAALRARAHHLTAIFHVGKGGVTPAMIAGVREALEARELIKIALLDNCELEVKEAAEIVASRSGAEIVQIIGKKFVLYKKSKTKKEGVL
ncbi:MAG: ribosome assembly RNA-binding protein YhbY [Clostridiales bacterium]|jgi:RNA-binding protein|nr:ribosome assembly RNA-binding protein YhbY [Clostridiales bacterium]